MQRHAMVALSFSPVLTSGQGPLDWIVILHCYAASTATCSWQIVAAYT